MQDFPGNSQKAARSQQGPPPARERVERITSAEAVRRKSGLGRQFKETFIAGSARLAWHYMITEVVVPSAKDMVNEALQSGIERLIYGETRHRRGPTSYANVGAPHINYSRMSTSSAPPRGDSQPNARMLSRGARARQSFDDIVIPVRQEAEEVIEMMFNILGKYGSVSVAEFYALVGIQAAHTDHKWGWTDLRGSKVEKLTRTGGFLLNLPEPEHFD